MVRRSSGTVNWSIYTWPCRTAISGVVGFLIWQLASSKASILRELNGSSIAFFYLASESVESLPPHAIDYKKSPKPSSVSAGGEIGFYLLKGKWQGLTSKENEVADIIVAVFDQYSL